MKITAEIFAKIQEEALGKKNTGRTLSEQGFILAHYIIPTIVDKTTVEIGYNNRVENICLLRPPFHVTSPPAVACRQYMVFTNTTLNGGGGSLCSSPLPGNDY
jgi:hypothetical protein